MSDGGPARKRCAPAMRVRRDAAWLGVNGVDCQVHEHETAETGCPERDFQNGRGANHLTRTDERRRTRPQPLPLAMRPWRLRAVPVSDLDSYFTLGPGGPLFAPTPGQGRLPRGTPARLSAASRIGRAVALVATSDFSGEYTSIRSQWKDIKRSTVRAPTDARIACMGSKQ